MDAGKENYNPLKNEETSREDILEIIEALEEVIEFMKPFASGKFIAVAIPRELFLEISLPKDEDGSITQVPFQFTVVGKKLIIEQVADRDFECDGDCDGCPFYEIDCDGDNPCDGECENCPCSEECDESEVF